MRQALRIAIVLVLSVVLAASPAAACCDDFWSCAAAVATAGLTCAAELAVNALRGLIASVRAAREAHLTEFEKGLAQLQAECDGVQQQLAKLDQKIKNDMLQIEKEAAAIVGEDAEYVMTAARSAAAASLLAKPASPTPTKDATAAGSMSKMSAAGRGLVAPTPTRAPLPGTGGTAAERVLIPLDAHESMKDLQREIAELDRKTKGQLLVVLHKKKEAAARQLEAAEMARKVFENSFLTRVDALLASLDRALTHPLEIGSLVSAAAGLFDGLVSGYDRDVPPAVDKAGAETQAALQLPVPAARQASDYSRQARATLDKMRRARAVTTAAARRSLPMNVLAPGSSDFSAASGRLSPAAVSLLAISKKTTPRLVALRPDFDKVRASMLAKVDVAHFRTRVGSELDGMLRGKSQADGRKKRDELIGEARRRYASDPKTLQAVESYLLAEARSRGVN